MRCCFEVGPVRLVEAYPEEEREVAGRVEESREGIGNGLRVPLELTFGIRADMGFRHVAGEVTTRLKQRRQNGLSIWQRRVQIFGSRRVRVLTAENAYT